MRSGDVGAARFPPSLSPTDRAGLHGRRRLSSCRVPATQSRCSAQGSVRAAACRGINPLPTCSQGFLPGVPCSVVALLSTWR